MERLLEEFPNDLRFAYRHFPLIGTPEQPFHDKASLSVRAAEAAGKQGKFWDMYTLLYGQQNTWNTLSVEEYQTWLIEQAGKLGLDVDKFTADLNSQELIDLAQNDWDRGQDIGLPGTPFLLINGNSWPSNVSMDYWNLSAVIKLTQIEDRQFTECPPMTINQAKQYTATIKTEKGNIIIELYADKAPLAVNSFIFLAKNGWFDGITFHRVISGFVAQTGDPTGTGFGGPGYSFKNEISDLKFDQAGVVGMANAGVDTNGSQFFITFAPAPNLDGNYTIFGQVISGMDVLTSLTPRDPSQNTDLPPGDKIITITIEEK
jgi:cyclophilin family peptidyl-prolyl cis-trans isomerase